MLYVQRKKRINFDGDESTGGMCTGLKYIATRRTSATVTIPYGSSIYLCTNTLLVVGIATASAIASAITSAIASADDALEWEMHA